MFRLLKAPQRNLGTISKLFTVFDNRGFTLNEMGITSDVIIYINLHSKEWETRTKFETQNWIVGNTK